jgi:hypothetical protein
VQDAEFPNVAHNAMAFCRDDLGEGQEMTDTTMVDEHAEVDVHATAMQTAAPIERSSAVLTAAILGLTAVAAMVHLSLGGLLFTLNGFGYAGLAGLILIAYWGTNPLIVRFNWFPRLALMGYAATTIVGYLVIGPYSTLGWFTKAVEVTLITLLAVDTLRAYGGVSGTVRKVVGSIRG